MSDDKALNIKGDLSNICWVLLLSYVGVVNKQDSREISIWLFRKHENKYNLGWKIIWNNDQPIWSQAFIIGRVFVDGLGKSSDKQIPAHAKSHIKGRAIPEHEPKTLLFWSLYSMSICEFQGWAGSQQEVGSWVSHLVCTTYERTLCEKAQGAECVWLL